MLADAELPSIVGLITGESIKGSWWGHPLGNLIFNSASDVEDMNDVLTVKLLKGKVTFVHQALWEPLLAIVSSRDEWQMKKLSAACLKALAEIDKKGRILSENLTKVIKLAPKDVANLEKRCLVLTQQVHTDSGAHAKYFVSWKQWSSDNGVKLTKSAESRHAAFENIASCVKKFSKDLKCLPWPVSSM